MKWFSGFVGEERMRLELKTFGTQHIQLGDVISLDYHIPRKTISRYDNEAGFEYWKVWNPSKNETLSYFFEFYGSGKKYIVRKISTSSSGDGPENTLSLVEIPIRSDWNPGEW